MAEASRDILKFRVSEMPFPGVSRRYFPPRMPEYMQDWEQCGWNVPGIPNIAWFKRFTDLNLFKYSFNIIQNLETDALQIFFNGAFFC